MSEYECARCNQTTHCSELDDDLICRNCRESGIDRICDLEDLK